MQNQRLLDSDIERVRQKDGEINELKKKITQLQSTVGDLSSILNFCHFTIIPLQLGHRVFWLLGRERRSDSTES